MQFNPQDVSRSFLFLPHLDAFGTDMRRVHGTLETILATAYHNPDCYAVNTLGFLKCNISTIMPSDFLRGSQDGVYVKISLLPQLAKSNPNLLRFIESMAVPLEYRIIFSPVLSNTGFWMSQTQLALKTFYMNSLAKIALDMSGPDVARNLIDGGQGIDWFQHANTQSKQRNVFDIAKTSSNILDIGFNTGFSCLLMLLANNFSKITCVETGIQPYVQYCFNFLQAEFPGRITLIKDLPEEVFSKLEGQKFDFVHVNGDQSLEGARANLVNALPLGSMGTVILFDGTEIDSLRSLFQLFVTRFKLRKYDLIPAHTKRHQACQMTLDTINIIAQAKEQSKSLSDLLE